MINAAFIRGCKPRAKTYEVTCEAMPGFILRVLPTGRKIALVRYRVDGKDRRSKIGQLGPDLSIEEARRRAALLLAQIATGVVLDERAGQAPASAPALVKQAEPRAPTSIPLRQLAERFLRVHVEVRLKPATAERYRSTLDTVVLPAFGDRDFRSVTKAELAELHGTMRDRPGAANNMLSTISSLYGRIIEDWELAEMRNPARGIKPFPMRRRERFLSPEERQRLDLVIQAGLRMPAGRRGHLDIESVWALDLLAFTGRRRDEILTLTWPMVDWQHSLLNLPDTKTGELRVPVSSRVLALLRHIHEQAGKPRVGYVLGKRLRGLNRTWENIRAAADLHDVRLHDLRHSFASDALMSGVPLAIVGELLGHKQARTTQRYAHLANHVVRQALEMATERIVDAVKPVAALPPAPFERLSDAEWARIKDKIASTRGRCGGTRVDLRGVVDGIRWVLKFGAKWREVPAEFGAATTCWRWYERWTAAGVWSEVMAALGASTVEPERQPSHRPTTKARIEGRSPREVIEVGVTGAVAVAVADSSVRFAGRSSRRADSQAGR
jgi:integrase/transposase